jgi:hypothetical protein
MALKLLLTVAGAAFEIVGLTWLVAEASRARSAEFGERGIFRRIWAWLAYWFGSPGQTVHVGSAHATAGGSLAVTGSLIRADETELERLGRELGELRDRVARHEEDAARRFAHIQGELRQTAQDLGARVDTIEVRHRELRRAAQRKDIRGAYLFMLGAVLNAIANLV